MKIADEYYVPKKTSGYKKCHWCGKTEYITDMTNYKGSLSCWDCKIDATLHKSATYQQVDAL
jgi:hypothetical protein